MHTTEQWPRLRPDVGLGPGERIDDAMVRGGRIGHREIERGCYSFYEVLGLAAEDLAANGAADAFDRSGLTVRAFLRERYGIFTAPAVAPGQDATEARIFRRVLRQTLSGHPRG